MTAPERIWAAPPTDDPEWASGAGEWDVSEHWTASGITEYIRADLSQPAQVRVKPLVWARYGSEDFEAASPLGLYRCIKTLFDTSVLWLDEKKLGIYVGGSHAEAKEVAQAHYEANVLEPQPDPRDEAIKGLVEAATDAAEAIDMAYGSDDDESPHRHSAKLRAALAAAKEIR